LMSSKTSVFIQPSTHGNRICGGKNNITIVIYDFKPAFNEGKFKK